MLAFVSSGELSVVRLFDELMRTNADTGFYRYVVHGFNTTVSTKPTTFPM
jgi:hypothetical protein